MFFKRKKLVKNVTRDNRFMKNCAIKVETLLAFAAEHENVQKELVALRDEFQYTVASPHPEAEALEKKIAKTLEKLSVTVRDDAWAEDEILSLIKEIRSDLGTINSLR